MFENVLIQVVPEPSESLTGRLCGRLDAVNKKMKTIRSRSVERQRKCRVADKLCGGEKDCVLTEEEGQKNILLNCNPDKIYDGPMT